ncbi:EAL domain-containing protein [Pseudomonas sp. KSR10]|jgi:EAL domain-containing protein (putative c-di-GMP-specific phosphodiesterase class I)|uniref:Diguanylate phosphodiesterase n=1 Tax=Stutzerimonas stutzeri TaxID=316 RepID=A0A0D9ASA0_STUST|nr:MULTISPECIES: EAL domain-containing protein [Pseudomonadaceae]KJH83559.1 diguanylate phosphodiesterase [Stutzerimonas stutzeri]MCG6540405.1 EAL domain-containing protein [Pseudomonas sp. KSR10]
MNRDSELVGGSELLQQVARDERVSLSVDEILTEALYTVRRHLGMEVAFIGEFREGLRVFRHIDGNPRAVALTVGDGGPLEESYCQRIVDGRLPELIHDAAELKEALALPETQTIPIGAHMSVPIRFSDGSLYGTFCCFSTQADQHLDQSDLSTMRLFATFAGGLLERNAQREQLHRDKLERIKAVIARRDFWTVYQPIFHLADDTIVGYEALARFRAEPYRSPDLWFEEAGEVGLRTQLETLLLETALEGLRLIPEDVYLSLNVCPEALLDGSVIDLLARQPLHRLMLEVTEHTSIVDYVLIAAQLEPLRQAGLRLAVDDAGAGYASLRHILKLKPDVIKLDRSLISNVDSDSDCCAMAAALIRFADQTGSKIIAEGVETDAELKVLRDLKVTKAQGFLLGMPLPLEHPVG